MIMEYSINCMKSDSLIIKGVDDELLVGAIEYRMLCNY